MTLTLRYAARSDRGLIRDGNQDSVYAGPRLLAVADGMGGMAAGDVASNIVIGAMAPLDEDVPGRRPGRRAALAPWTPPTSSSATRSTPTRAWRAWAPR